VLKLAVIGSPNLLRRSPAWKAGAAKELTRRHGAAAMS